MNHLYKLLYYRCVDQLKTINSFYNNYLGKNTYRIGLLYNIDMGDTYHIPLDKDIEFINPWMISRYKWLMKAPERDNKTPQQFIDDFVRKGKFIYPQNLKSISFHSE